MKTILVVMEGGVIQDIMGIPKDCEVVVRDFDVEGIDLGDYLERGQLFTSPAGEMCTEVTWGPSDPEDNKEFRPATRADLPRWVGED